LKIRIGLNSGPTMAGVLRGEKARFQLFGDVSACLYVITSRSLDVYLTLAELVQLIF
jgi:hypothetical protein